MSFPCTACGACCKNAGYIPDFPEPILPGTKTCVHLAADNRCVVYRTRPEVCRIKSDFAANAACCNILQGLTNTPTKYRLPILDIE